MKPMNNGLYARANFSISYDTDLEDKNATKRIFLRHYYLKNWTYLPNCGSLPIMTRSSSHVRKVAMLAT